MVLKVGDIMELEKWGNKCQIIEVTETTIIYNIYPKNNKPIVLNKKWDKKDFESFKWKRAKLKWY